VLRKTKIFLAPQKSLCFFDGSDPSQRAGCLKKNEFWLDDASI